jgi:UDP:flavonoid glycosyltransferase YjiC (YdhE family)
MAPCTFVFVPVGSHGDVHPLLGLALALQARGHRCLFCANGYFRAMITARGLDFIELGSAEQYLHLTGLPELWHPRKGPLLLFSAPRVSGAALALVTATLGAGGLTTVPRGPTAA